MIINTYLSLFNGEGVYAKAPEYYVIRDTYIARLVKTDKECVDWVVRNVSLNKIQGHFTL
jgi:hypothetical protein